MITVNKTPTVTDEFYPPLITLVDEKDFYIVPSSFNSRGKLTKALVYFVDKHPPPGPLLRKYGLNADTGPQWSGTYKELYYFTCVPYVP